MSRPAGEANWWLTAPLWSSPRTLAAKWAPRNINIYFILEHSKDHLQSSGHLDETSLFTTFWPCSGQLASPIGRVQNPSAPLQELRGSLKSTLWPSWLPSDPRLEPNWLQMAPPNSHMDPILHPEYGKLGHISWTILPKRGRRHEAEAKKISDFIF